jgi:hypothetical protein
MMIVIVLNSSRGAQSAVCFRLMSRGSGGGGGGVAVAAAATAGTTKVGPSFTKDAERNQS